MASVVGSLSRFSPRFASPRAKRQNHCQVGFLIDCRAWMTRGEMRSIVQMSKTVYCGLLAGSLALLAGCGGAKSDAPFKPDPAVANFPKMGRAVANSPEMKIAALKTPQEQATFLQGLATDANFDPKLHKEMLEKYSKNSDADVAAAAKALLDR